MIIVDTNIIASLYLENPHRAEIEALLARDYHWLAPRLWRSELRNVLALYVRQNKVELDTAIEIMAASEELVQAVAYEPLSADVLRLAHDSGCSAYDCEFIAFARDLGTVLITFDRKLLKQFPTLAMTPAHFLAS